MRKLLFRLLRKYLAPNGIEFALNEAQEKLDDPTTSADDKLLKDMIDANKAYLQYRADKLLS